MPHDDDQPEHRRIPMRIERHHPVGHRQRDSERIQNEARPGRHLVTAAADETSTTAPMIVATPKTTATITARRWMRSTSAGAISSAAATGATVSCVVSITSALACWGVQLLSAQSPVRRRFADSPPGLRANYLLIALALPRLWPTGSIAKLGCKQRSASGRGRQESATHNRAWRHSHWPSRRKNGPLRHSAAVVRCKPAAVCIRAAPPIPRHRPAANGRSCSKCCSGPVRASDRLPSSGTGTPRHPVRSLCRCIDKCLLPDARAPLPLLAARAPNGCRRRNRSAAAECTWAGRAYPAGSLPSAPPPPTSRLPTILDAVARTPPSAFWKRL